MKVSPAQPSWPEPTLRPPQLLGVAAACHAECQQGLRLPPLTPRCREPGPLVWG